MIIELDVPLRGVSEKTGEHVVAFGLWIASDVLRWLVVEGTDGRVAMADYADLRIDWRYDPAKGWIDVGARDEPEG